MEQMIRYIFGSLRRSEASIRAMNKILSRQKTFNRNMTFFALTTVVYMAVREAELYGVYRELASLKAKIEEFKKSEGD